MIELHYLTEEEEQAIKVNIPWTRLDPEIRELVMLFNKIAGIATLQSCAGHINLGENNSFIIDNAHITFRATLERTERALYIAVPMCNIADVSLRYFEDGTFWISVETDPAQKYKLYRFCELMQS